MTDRLLLGWPFEDNPPIKYGEVEGIPWAIARGGTEIMPIVNGYARIPWEGHPWTGITDRDDMPVQVHGGLTWGPHPGSDFRETFENLNDTYAELEPPIPEFVSLPVPDFVFPAATFSDVGGWVGFDTGHAWDVWSDEALAEAGITRKHLPELDDLLRKPIFGNYQIDWTMEAVIAEAQSLAHQIAQAGVTGSREDNPVQLRKGEREWP